MLKLKREEAGSLSKIESLKLQWMYTQGGAAFGSARDSVRISNLPVSMLRQFLHSKPWYTRFTLATSKFKRLKAIARFKNEIRCMDLAYVDKPAKHNNGVKHLLVRQDMFDRAVDAKGMKTKASKETVREFLTMITNKNLPQKYGSKKEQNLLESLKNCAKLKEYNFNLQWKRLRLHLLDVQNDLRKIYFTVTWKIMDTGSFLFCLNSSQPRNLEKNCSIDLIPNNVSISDFLSFLHSNSLPT